MIFLKRSFPHSIFLYFLVFPLLLTFFSINGLNDPGDILEKYGKNVPGVFVAVVKDDSVLYRGSYGKADLESENAITSEDLMELGSNSKQFTADLIKLLEHEGYLKTKDQIDKYFPDAPASWSGITIQHLLDHTSGIMNYLLDERFKAAELFRPKPNDTASQNFFLNITPDAKIRMFYSLPVEFTPGSTWSYSNTGYILLGKIAEKVTGKKFYDLLKEKILKPCGMYNTMENEVAEQKSLLAEGYYFEENKYFQAPVLRSNYAFSAGTMASSGEDMIRYMKAVHKRKLAVDNTKYKWREFPHDNEFPFLYRNGRFYFKYHGRKIITHNGGTPGFSSSWFYSVNDNTSVIVLINLQDYPFVDHFAWDLLSFYIPQLRWRDKIINSYDVEEKKKLIMEVINAARNNSPMPSLLAQPLKTYFESANGRGIINWVFLKGFPEKISCIDKEKVGSLTTFRFLLSYNEVTYRLTAVFNSKSELVRLMWW